jgi:sugar lactone lactonase YvrE
MAAPSAAAPTKPAPALSLHDAGFSTPESVYYDAKNDVYLVSNINGSPGAADNNGFLSRVTPDGKVELKWIEGGKKNVKLDAPKGIAIAGDTIYVADITRVRMFEAASGKPKGEVAVQGASFLNDVAAGPDGKIYVSDSGIKIDEKGVTPTGSDAVYVIEKGKAKVLAKGEDLGHPNGLAVSGDKVWVVAFGSGELYSLDKTGKKGDAQKLPKGTLDGLVAVGDSLLASSWEGQAVYRGKPGGTFEVVIPDVKSPADIGYDTKRSRVLVPLFQDNAVEAYELK